MTRLVSFIVLVGIIVVISILFYRVMASFLLPLFLAGVLVVVFRPLHEWILLRCQGRETVAALLTTALVFFIVVGPSFTVVTLAALEGAQLVEEMNTAGLKGKLNRLRDRFELLRMPHVTELRFIKHRLDELITDVDRGGSTTSHPAQLAAVQERLNRIQSSQHETTSEMVEDFEQLQEALAATSRATSQPVGRYREQLVTTNRLFHNLKLSLLGGPVLTSIKEIANPTDAQLQAIGSEIGTRVRPWLFSLSGKTTAVFGGMLLVMIITPISLFFFLTDGPRMIQTVMRLSPLEDHYEQELLGEFVSISRAVVLATLLSALVQGLLAGLGYWLAGLDSVFLLMLLTGVMALIPLLGTSIIWVPTSLWLFIYEERTLAAALLALYGALVVSTADNLIKPVVLHGQSRLHPLLALLSVLGGVKALGPVGVLVGPMVVVFLQTLLNILHRELMSFDEGAVVDG